MGKNYIYILFSISIVFAAYSCQQENYVTDFTPSIVVDGRIESNGYPYVFLTHNIPYYVDIDSNQIEYLVLRQAKITVSDGESSEILTLKRDKKLFPPFYYQGNELMGEPGKTYALTVEYGNTILTATTTIPFPVTPDSAWFQPKRDTPDKGLILVRLHDNPNETDYYKMFTRIEGKQTGFIPTLLSDYSDKWINGQNYVFQLNKGPDTYLNMNDADFYFSRNDTISLKVCTLDKEHFDFWYSYRNEVANGANPLASSYHTINSNIKGDGIGIWGGFGVTIIRVIAK
jgi:hypothetical protein